MSSLLIKNASAVVTCDGRDSVLENASLLIRDGVITYMGREDIGSLEPGKAGDLFLIRRDRLELVGADLGVSSLLGTVGFKGPVDYTVVNGRVAVREGRLTGIDEEKAVREGRAAASAYLDR